MNASPLPLSFPALAWLSAVLAASPALAQQSVLEFNGPRHIDRGAHTGDVEFGRATVVARGVTHSLYAFGPSTPPGDYSGPAFNLGFEVRASAPSNLTVAPDKAVVEDDFVNLGSKLNDTIAITAYGDWAESETYSVAAVVVFPTAKFNLEALSYSALNWTTHKPYNDKLRHRWVVQTGGKYYVSRAFVGRTGRKASDHPVDVIQVGRAAPQFDQWVEYDPERSIFANLEGPRVVLGALLDEVTAVGFYLDATDYPGAPKGQRQWQLRLLSFSASGFPAATSAR